MSQNICLICCHSFQEKPIRIISKEARESFYKLSEQLDLGLQIPHLLNEEPVFTLPFGEGITVCGDCLSLVLAYVQQKSVQVEKEEHLLQLQLSVCKAIKELSKVVESVEWCIEQLQTSIRLGDESNLYQFTSSSRDSGHRQEDKRESQMRLFRKKLLDLNTCGSAPQKSQSGPVKAEPMESATYDLYGEGIVLMDNSNIHLHKNAAELKPKFAARSKFRREFSGGNSDSTLDENHSRTEICDDDSRQFYDGEDDHMNYSDGQVSDHDDSEDEDFMIKKTGKAKQTRRKVGRPPKVPGGLRKKSSKYGKILHPQKAAQWKENLLSRVMEQYKKDAANEEIESSRNEQLAVNDEQNQDDNENESVSKLMKVVDGQLELCGITIKITPNKRMLECQKCGRMYFEERDVTSESVNLETLMKNHILEKHYVVKKKKVVKEVEVISFVSQTKSKITYRIADNFRYSYHRSRVYGTDDYYYRCDFRKGKCSATILHKDGKFIRLRKGWNEDGTHAIHSPDVDHVNRMIAIGNAKAMYLAENSKSIDEVCSIIRNQADERVLPLMKLKRAMRYSKYGKRCMAPEEKVEQEQQCCYCGKIFKDRRSITRHMKKDHPDDDSVEQNRSREFLHGADTLLNFTKLEMC